MQKVSGVNRRNLTKYYRLLIKEFNWQIPVVDPTQCVVRIANNAGVSEKTKRTAIDILHKVKQQGFIDGKDPTSVAAAAIYIAGKKTAVLSDQFDAGPYLETKNHFSSQYS
ncbi:Transcription initiation factor IIB 1 protein [Marine Group I thaumarchaeote SCGC RSA3]|uniref:Transcription initiation factor IIB 1 protein n=1 Tax=Marine Group I thaumarchaeote SCGC RSA3 TaxID=1503183 RepID=A0A087RUV0_9ARCH|nr:Transcription initiation factor IIB 1 protein [Marine Group I thaumarchaeote SCGC RSA3]